MRSLLVLPVLLLLLSSPTKAAVDSAEDIFYLLVIDSQTGEPYDSVRRSALRHLAELASRDGIIVSPKHYSIGNYPDAVGRILAAESSVRYQGILLNGTMALIGARQSPAVHGPVPFVFASVTDPVGIGVIDGFDRPPKGRFTGVAYAVPVAQRLLFISKRLPRVRTLGLIYADMPQSQSYNRWLEAALQEPPFAHLRLVKRPVPFIPGDGGHIRMAMLAEKEVKELDPLVDAFLAPSDQMGVQRPFVEAVRRSASKPLIGIGKSGVSEGWGATLSIYPSPVDMGKTVAEMLWRVYQGEPVTAILPRTPASGIAFDIGLCRRFGVHLPEAGARQSGTLVLE